MRCTDSVEEKGAESKAVRAVGGGGPGGPTRRSSSQDGPPRTALQGGSLFCPRNTELVPTGPVPPGEAAGRQVCLAPGNSPEAAVSRDRQDCVPTTACSSGGA